MLNMKIVLLACLVDVFLARLGFLLNSNPSLHMVDGYKKDAIVNGLNPGVSVVRIV